jgi:hypothetical protein
LRPPKGEGDQPEAPLELNDVLHIQTNDGTAMPFEVVGILEDSEARVSYAVLLHEPADESEGQFIVTDLTGNLIEDEALAQEVLDDFLALAEEDDSAGGRNGEMS